MPADKEVRLPACSLCVRIGRLCDYTPESQPALPSAEEFAALRDQVANLEQLLRSNAAAFGSQSAPAGTPTGSSSNGSANGALNLSNGNSPSNFPALGQVPTSPSAAAIPALFFLDSNAFEYERLQFQPPHVKVPPGALSALGSSTELRDMIEYYFATVHNYFPIISKIRLYQHLANPLHEPGADIALLFLAMKLICREVPDGSLPQTQLYHDVKSFYTFVESQNGFSIQLIQTLCLISLYEIGHCIYPAAYLSIGNAARTGYALGLHDRTAPQMLPRCSTWTEMEERRRVWWGVIILDRFVNIGHRRKPFATVDPSLDTHLPTDDSAWDRGQMLVAAPLSLSASETIRVSPFARTCQSAHILGKVIRHIDDRQLPLNYRFGEALQLDRTMRALADVLPDEIDCEATVSTPSDENDPTQRPSLCTSIAMIYSGLITLYDAYSCTENSALLEAAAREGGEDRLRMQKASIDGLSEISSRVVNLARKIRKIVDTKGLSVLSPMVVDSIYKAAACCMCSPSS